MDGAFLPFLDKQNVWWHGRIEDDPHILQWHARPKRWMPFGLDRLSTDPFSLNFVVGPRQAGKTTLVKMAIRQLLSYGIEPRRIAYIRCDEITDAATLRSVVQTVLAHGRPLVYLFLDEITDVSGWEKTLKGLIDDGDLKSCAVTVTGSNAFSLQKGAELFPGRRGNGKNVLVLPLSFRQFVQVVRPDVATELPRVDQIDKLDLDSFARAMPHLSALQKLLLDYFACGGFPLSLSSYLESGRVSEEASEVYRSWVIGDILKAGKSEVLSREIVKVILSKAPSPMSWEAISQETAVKSPPTVASYVELLERMFVLLPLNAVNPSKGTKEFSKNKKIHLLDPFLWRLFQDWTLQEIHHETDVFAEAAAAAHVARFLQKHQHARRLSEDVSYWRNGSEVDVVAHGKKGLSGFEVKWSSRFAAFPAKVGPIQNTVYLSKDVFRPSSTPVIPLSLFLAALDC